MRSTSRNVRRIGSCQHTSGLVSSGCRPCWSARACSAQPAPRWKSLRLWKMHASWPSTSTVSVLRAALVVGLHPVPASDLARRPELPGVLVELGDEAGHPLLVGLVGEVRAERAAAGVRRRLVDPVAALPEDAGVRRGQPRQVAAEHLVGVVRDPGTRSRPGGSQGPLLAPPHPTATGGYRVPHEVGRARHRIQHRSPARVRRARRSRAASLPPTRSRSGWPSTSTRTVP